MTKVWSEVRTQQRYISILKVKSVSADEDLNSKALDVNACTDLTAGDLLVGGWCTETYWFVH